jgi:hypothetical protein
MNDNGSQCSWCTIFFLLIKLTYILALLMTSAGHGCRHCLGATFEGQLRVVAPVWYQGSWALEQMPFRLFSLLPMALPSLCSLQSLPLWAGRPPLLIPGLLPQASITLPSPEFMLAPLSTRHWWGLRLSGPLVPNSKSLPACQSQCPPGLTPENMKQVPAAQGHRLAQLPRPASDRLSCTPGRSGLSSR